MWVLCFIRDCGLSCLLVLRGRARPESGGAAAAGGDGGQAAAWQHSSWHVVALPEALGSSAVVQSRIVWVVIAKLVRLGVCSSPGAVLFVECCLSCLLASPAITGVDVCSSAAFFWAKIVKLQPGSTAGVQQQRMPQSMCCAFGVSQLQFRAVSGPAALLLNGCSHLQQCSAQLLSAEFL
jgi:hypothetical protein